jgi:RNA polymerase sigma factor (sigma-70 family)
MFDSALGAGIRPLDADDPLPPDDRLSTDKLRAELEMIYRSRAGGLADQLARSGARDGLDLVHEAFARLLAIAGPKLVSISKPHAYLATITKNLRNDGSRNQCVHKSWAAESAATGIGHHDQVVYLESRDALRRLESAVLQLKPITRKIFLARRVEGLSYAEISQLTGMTPNAIEKHMSKAIAKLSRLMDRD